MTLGSDTVFTVTGAAGGIVSAIVADLAKAAGGGIFHLLDLTPEPDPADPDLIRFATDRDGLKTAITERLAAGGQRPTPVLIEKELARYERLRSALVAIQSVREVGGQAYYHAVDLTDPGAVADVVAGIASQHGRVDVLLHAAGLDISHPIADKDAREFGLVFDVKADGWFNLLHAAADLPVGATVVFSSVAGRFGNVGQTDYAAANDLLCKVTSSFRTTRPETRAIALDWTAWGGLGMATRGSIPNVMARAGIEMLAPEAGIPWIRQELTAAPFRGEVVVGGQLGLLTAELDPDRRPRPHRGRPGRCPPDGGDHHRDGRLFRADRGNHPRPGGAAVPARPPHRRRGGAARGDGHRGIRRTGRPRRARIPGRGHRGDGVPGASEVLP